MKSFQAFEALRFEHAAEESLQEEILSKTNQFIFNPDILILRCGCWVYAKAKGYQARQKLISEGFRYDKSKEPYPFVWHPGGPVKKRFPYHVLNFQQVKKTYGCSQVA